MENIDIDTEVLIVGAGPTGLLLASELLRRGISCQLIDSLAGPSEKSRALAIHARTLEVLDQIGLIDEFLSIGWKSKALTVFDRKKQIVRMAFDGLDSPFPFLLSLPQWHTERILADNVRTKGGVIQWDRTLVNFRQEADKVIAKIRSSKAADITEQTNSGDQTLTCKWLIGCDGAHSAVRNILNIDFPGVPYWEQYVLADVNFETSLNTEDHYVFSGAEGVAGFHPFAVDSARIFADVGRIRRPRGVTSELPADRERFPEPTQEELQKILDERGPGTVKITKINWQSMHTIHRRLVQSFRHDRVLLAGDAAHIHSPAGGQGMNLGLQDAYNLAWKLALVQKKIANEALLDSYSTERRLTCKRVTAMSDFFSRVNNVRSPLTQAVRNLVGPMLAEQANVKRDYKNAITQLSLNYRYSPVVSEHTQRDLFSVLRPRPAMIVGKTPTIDWALAPQAGDRAPNAMATETLSKVTVRVFDLFRTPEHHLLLFSGPHADANDSRNLVDIAAFVKERYGSSVKCHLFVNNSMSFDGLDCGEHIYMDPELTIHTKYGAASACLFLIRPDMYIGFRSRPASKQALSDYLRSIF